METIFNAADESVASGVRGNMPLHIWLHEVKLASIRAGAKAEWITERFGHRFVEWFDVGETVGGAVDMVLFTMKREAIETRGERELEHLRNFVHERVEQRGELMKAIAKDLREGTFRGVTPGGES